MSGGATGPGVERVHGPDEGGGGAGATVRRILLGKAEHWLMLAAFVAVLYGMGGRHMHVRAFVPFSVTLLATVTVALGLIVWRHRPGERITRESFDDAELPHGGREEEEV
jgi:hypothetical protein